MVSTRPTVVLKDVLHTEERNGTYQNQGKHGECPNKMT